MPLWVDLVRRWVPPALRYHIQRLISLDAVKRRYRARKAPFADVLAGDEDRLGLGVRVGIFFNRSYYHTDYVAACRELGVPFRVVDLSAEDWQQQVRTAGCGLFLAWPDASQTSWAKMFKDRCDLVETAFKLPVYPAATERWLYEDKVRLADWLRAGDWPHARTWTFFDRDAAWRFALGCTLPVVFKLPFGAAASGVRIVRRRRELLGCIRRAFAGGHVPNGHDRHDRQRGSILLQEFLPDLVEWRMVRIGDSYFGHPKGRVGQFHSGSGRVEWTIPGNELLDLLFLVTESSGFRSMAMDVFELPDGRLLINELQTVFGASVAVHQLKRDGEPGRMIRSDAGQWQFEAGDFARNACANARVLDALAIMRPPANAIADSAHAA